MHIQVSLHLMGFVLGYSVPALLGYATPVARTVAIETGMQNSALGVVLATKNFADPLTALPCAISATCHSVCFSECLHPSIHPCIRAYMHACILACMCTHTHTHTHTHTQLIGSAFASAWRWVDERGSNGPSTLAEQKTTAQTVADSPPAPGE